MRLFILGVLLLAGPAEARHAPVACERVSDSNLPPAFAAWADEGVEIAAANGASAIYPAIDVGVPVEVRLHPDRQVRLGHPPAQARTPEDAHAGLVTFAIPAAGRWRISASAPVWIDVLAPGGPVVSAAHGRMAPCTTIRKVVEFDLAPGRHTLQLSGNPGPRLRLMISRAP